MRRSILLFLLVSAVSSITFAQDSPWHRSLAVHAGLCLPFDEFAEHNFSSDAGFANPGANLEGDFLFYLEHVGFCFTLGYSNLGFNRKAYRASYDAVILEEGEISVNAGIYQSMKSTLGFCIRGPEFLNTEIFLQVQAGIALNVHPEISVTHSYWGLINSIQRDTDWQSISVLGLTLNHRLNEKYGICLSYDANFTLPYFSDASSFQGFDLPMRFQNISLGIKIQI